MREPVSKECLDCKVKHERELREMSEQRTAEALRLAKQEAIQRGRAWLGWLVAGLSALGLLIELLRKVKL